MSITAWTRTKGRGNHMPAPELKPPGEVGIPVELYTPKSLLLSRIYSAYIGVSSTGHSQQSLFEQVGGKYKQ